VSFRFKLGILLAIVALASVSSQLVYRNIISTLHASLSSTIDGFETLHAVENFHSSLHMMLTIVSRSAAAPSPADQAEYRSLKKGTVESFRRLISSIEGSKDLDHHLDIRNNPSLVDDIRLHFEEILVETEAVYGAAPSEAATHAAKARTIFDELFEKYLNELHAYHQNRLEALKIEAHRQTERSDLLFYLQLAIILAAAIVAVIFSNQVLLKGFKVAELGAFSDSLTGLHNRKYLAGPVMEKIGEMLSSREPFSLILVDIDHFKRFNDTYGHQAGDAALKEVAQRLRLDLRKSDILIRYGGEEFLAILPGADKTSALITANKVREHLAVTRFEGQGRVTERVTASFGLASFPEDGTVGYAGLFKMADDRLYRAKAEGRNKVVG